MSTFQELVYAWPCLINVQPSDTLLLCCIRSTHTMSNSKLSNHSVDIYQMPSLIMNRRRAGGLSRRPARVAHIPVYKTRFNENIRKYKRIDICIKKSSNHQPYAQGIIISSWAVSLRNLLSAGFRANFTILFWLGVTSFRRTIYLFFEYRNIPARSAAFAGFFSSGFGFRGGKGRFLISISYFLVN